MWGSKEIQSVTLVSSSFFQCALFKCCSVFLFIPLLQPNTWDSTRISTLPPSPPKLSDLPSLPPPSVLHPQVQGSSPQGSAKFPPVSQPILVRRGAPPFPHRCCLDGSQYTLGPQVLVLSCTSQGLASLPQPTQSLPRPPTYGLEHGNPRETRAARVPARRRRPCPREPSFLPPGSGHQALSQEGSRRK